MVSQKSSECFAICSSVKPGANGGAPEGDVLAAITRDLGGVDKMKDDFNGAGLRVFGSGWTFITVDKDGKLTPADSSPIIKTRSGPTPLT